MPQTKAQKNETARASRHGRTFNRYRERKAQMLELWVRAAKEKLHVDEINSQAGNISLFDGVPGWVSQRLIGCFDFMIDLAYRTQLTFCYDHPHTGVPTDSGVLCDDGLASLLDVKTGHHYWNNADGTFTHRFN